VLLDALEDAGITFTLCKHENAAGFMAEGSWHATGAPGILLTTIGPGLANAMNSIANAFQEQVPLIVLSGCIGHAEAEQFTHQVIDQAALMAPVTKARFRVATGTAALVVEKALATALADPPGPVHLDLPDTLAASPAQALATSAMIREPAVWADGPARKAAVSLLENANRPLILAGVGAVHHRAADAILALSEARGIPVLTTYKAKGIIPEDHPNALGGHGLSPVSDSHILPLLAGSDCIVLAGYDPIEMRSGWIRPWAAENAIEICHAPVEHGMHGSAIRFAGDVRAGVEALHAGLSASPRETWPDGTPAQARAALRDVFAGRNRWGPHQIFATLNAAMPDGGVATADSGAHRILLSQIWQCDRPSSLLQSSAFCTMGIAVPLAMGYKRAAPDVPVLAVVGDGGFDMTAGELATLRDMQLPLVIVVLADDSLALIEKKQAAMQLEKRGVSFPGSDIAAVARAYGGHGAVVQDRQALLAELETAWTRGTFTVLVCPIDKGDYDGAF
jgi:acetolactate synthase-1/2/3 large subunit